MLLQETSIYQAYSAQLQKDLDLYASMAHFEMMVKGVFTGISKYLSDTKTVELPTVLTITDYKGDTVFTASCEYDEAVEGQDETTGSWLINVKFGGGELPEKAKIVDIKEPACFKAFVDGAKMNGYEYLKESDIISIAIITMRTITDWLDANASDSEIVSVEQPGVFTAKVAVEGGEKVFGIELAEEIKKIVKGTGDELLSKAPVK
jgi:hypothetical protein